MSSLIPGGLACLSHTDRAFVPAVARDFRTDRIRVSEPGAFVQTLRAELVGLGGRANAAAD